MKLIGVSKERNENIESLVQQLRAEMTDLADYQRLEIIGDLLDGYCR